MPHDVRRGIVGRGVYVRFAHEISYCKQYGDIVFAMQDSDIAFFKGSDIFAVANARCTLVARAWNIAGRGVYVRVAKMCEKLAHTIEQNRLI